jgi:hypothetical protein
MTWTVSFKGWAKLTQTWRPSGRAVEQHHAVLAEEPGQVIASIGGDERVVGRAPDAGIAGDSGLDGVSEVRYPDRTGLEQAEDKAVARGIGDTHHLGALPTRFGGDVGAQVEGGGVEDLDPTWLVVGHGDEPPILGDGPADAVAGLDHAPLDMRRQQVYLGQPAVAPEDIGIAGIPGVDDGGVGEVPEALHRGEAGTAGGLHDLDSASGAFYDDAEVAGAPQLAGTRRTHHQTQHPP